MVGESEVGSDIIGLFPILDCFYTFLPIVRGRLALLEELAFEFCRERKKHNIIYTEVRLRCSVSSKGVI